MKHSYSSLKAFLECPRLWHAKYVARRLPKEDDAPALVRGREIHDTLEKAVLSGQPPRSIWTPPGLIHALHRGGARAEVKYDIGYMIGFLDVELWARPVVWMGDWKTGKYRVDEMQADVYAYLLWKKVDPSLTVEFNLIYVDAQKVHPPIRPNKRAIPRIDSIIEAAERHPDPADSPSPSWKCRWCPVTDCEYNKRK